MKIRGTVQCPVHGKQKVAVETQPVTEYRYVMAVNFNQLKPSSQFTAKCPKCERRLVVSFDRKKKP